MTRRAPFPAYRQRFPRGQWRVGSGFRFGQFYCDGSHGGECVLVLENLPTQLPTHHLGRRYQKEEGKAWGLVCVLSWIP